MKPNLAQKLSHYAFRLSFNHLPEEVIHEVKRRLMDSLGCALGALSSEPARRALKVVSRIQDPDGATLLGTRHQVSPDLAVFYNGLLIRYLDYNDTYLSKEPAHPSDNFSAALALGEGLHRSGRDFITAVVLGYEIQCRLCDAASIRSRGWDHVTYGAFSSALVASKLLKLKEHQIYHALNLAGVANVALRQTRVGELSMWKGFAFANAARNGVFAALLAQAGITGPAPIFEGDLGFFKLVSGPFQIQRLGHRRIPFKILDTFIKYFPAEYHAQSAIEAALEIRKKISDIHKIQAIRVKTFRTAIEIIGGEKEKWHPVSRETADHSLPFCVAVALMDGEVTLKQFSQRRIQDPVLCRLVQKVTVEEDIRWTRLYPKANAVSLEVKTKRGIFNRELLNAKGHAARPLSDDEVEEKFRRLSSRLLLPRQQNAILDKIWDLDQLKDVGIILKLLGMKG
ncbi:MAG: MmgE/PrpD family protein [Chlamydiae bacterium]|nr:MmgE/PrpD family protein [Chlamydiota bacterium]MBI3265730.1 MmgE/PrpD family protein [Chlamydiota bacterium]